MQDLICGLERASEPDRELDEAIALASGYCVSGVTVAYGRSFVDPDGNYIGACPRFTESIDAALTLVPEGSSLDRLGQFSCLSTDGKPLWQAFIRHRVLRNPFDKGKRGDKVSGTGLMPTPAIALCIAALKARSHLIKMDETK